MIQCFSILLSVKGPVLYTSGLQVSCIVLCVSLELESRKVQNIEMNFMLI